MSSLLLTTLDTGNTAWMIMATILVLLMSISGIALFYGGLVRQKNILSILMQTIFIVAVVSLIWVAFGYSWAFSTEYADTGNPLACVIGGFDKCFLHGISMHSVMPTGIPELTFAMFQCMFALITPALILGAFAERVKFGGYVLFTILWVIIAYFPMAHWVWGGGFLQEMGAVDFAGGTVVHINAGVAALVMALCVGKRDDYRAGHPITPHNITFVFMGMSFLWLGWFGFNAGSGLAADGLASNISTIVCFFMVAVVKEKFKYDDALDAFGVHGIGGILGSILTGVFATHYVTGSDGVQGALYGDWHQLWVQFVATAVSIVYSALVTYVIFKIVDMSVGVRVDKRVEEEGLDIYEHGESAYSN